MAKESRRSFFRKIATASALGVGASALLQSKISVGSSKKMFDLAAGSKSSAGSDAFASIQKFFAVHALEKEGYTVELSNDLSYFRDIWTKLEDSERPKLERMFESSFNYKVDDPNVYFILIRKFGKVAAFIANRKYENFQFQKDLKSLSLWFENGSLHSDFYGELDVDYDHNKPASFVYSAMLYVSQEFRDFDLSNKLIRLSQIENLSRWNFDFLISVVDHRGQKNRNRLIRNLSDLHGFKQVFYKKYKTYRPSEIVVDTILIQSASNLAKHLS